MPEAVPTVVIVNPDKKTESLIINESDYDAKKHTLWDERDLPKAKPAMDGPKEATSEKEPAAGMPASKK